MPERSGEAILAGLNPAQRDAVLHTEGPLLVLAGAGSGKTRVIAHRIAYLIARGVDPRRLLAVTFTNKAAGEMAQRVEALLTGWGVRTPLVATFHAACVRILRAEIHHLGYPRSFLIYDEDDRLGVVREVCREQGLDDRLWAPQAVVARLSRAKNQLQDADDVAAAARTPRDRQLAQLFVRYQARLRAAGALDFDDLLVTTVQLWQHHPEVLTYYQTLWRYVLVDEYQDTNAAQYRLLRLLTGERGNLCVVGDPDQSIYGFRGADLRNILDFERDFPACRVVRLEQNYRSTGRILEIASAVIAHNQARKDKALWTQNARGEPARLLRAWDEVGEAAWIARTVAGLRADGAGLDAVAVFYRTNAQSRVLEDAFRARGLPYHIVGSVRFYARQEVKDALAYLRLALNPHDDVAFSRAIAVPPRGIGKTALARLAEAAQRDGLSLFAASVGPVAAAIGGKPGRALREFASLRERLAALVAAPRPLAERVSAVVDAVGLREALRREGTAEAEARLENLDELCVAAAEFEAREGHGEPAAFLDSVALLSDADELSEPRAAVTLMTLHSAKGLEFPVVFLTGLEEGVFPHGKALEDPDAIEEERRLAYVGLTRAKERLFLSYACQRRLGAFAGMREPSRFLLEMPVAALVPVSGSARRTSLAGSTAREQPWPHAALDGPGGGVVGTPLPDEDYPLRVGARVRHARWGEGLLIGIERAGEDWVVTVNFRAVGRKRLALQYAHLEEL
ncbi:MAG: UvrD-helicase domain-containing protein [Candidatus Rokubacteria bacterium]|nr:UvrD-helicase domain-containing protein [Candidatus Rokubacteria bacterium]